MSAPTIAHACCIPLYRPFSLTPVVTDVRDECDEQSKPERKVHPKLKATTQKSSEQDPLSTHGLPYPPLLASNASSILFCFVLPCPALAKLTRNKMGARAPPYRRTPPPDAGVAAPSLAWSGLEGKSATAAGAAAERGLQHPDVVGGGFHSPFAVPLAASRCRRSICLDLRNVRRPIHACSLARHTNHLTSLKERNEY